MASRVQTAVTMRQVTGSMAGVVRGMEGAMKAMDLEKVIAPQPIFYTTASPHHPLFVSYELADRFFLVRRSAP